MRNEDIVCLEIEKKVRASHTQLTNSTNSTNNIIGVFYHEIIKYLTGYYLIKSSKFKNSYNYPVNFPFLNREFIDNPILLPFKQQPLKLNYKKFILVKSFHPINFYKTKLPVLGLNLTKENLFDLLLNFKVTPFVERSLLYLDDKDIQINALKGLLLDVFDFLGEPNIGIYIKNFLNFLELYLTNRYNKIQEEFLLIGSPSVLLSRIMSANFQNQNKKVIATAHGGVSNTRFDEPYVGYGELSYCNYYIDFGSNDDYKRLEFGIPLGEVPEVYHLSSKWFRKILKNKHIHFKELNSKLKIGYIPTGFSLNMRYGPFRDIDDELYIEWQRALFKLDLNLIYKAHPNHYNFDLSFAKNKEFRNFFSCYNDFDFFIIDYIGTAHAIAAATDKPIIYFNLGLRNMTPDFLDKFKKRVFWYDVDLNEDLFEQINNAVDLYNASGKSFENEFTEEDSFSNTSKISTILNQIISSL